MEIHSRSSSAKTRFLRLANAAAGVIDSAGKPAVQSVQTERAKVKHRLGRLKGAARMADDFDVSLPVMTPWCSRVAELGTDVDFLISEMRARGKQKRPASIWQAFNVAFDAWTKFKVTWLRG